MLVLRIKQIIIELFRAIIDANHTRLLILVLESIQWIDPASLDILYNLCEVRDEWI
jgi:predicted ATPase